MSQPPPPSSPSSSDEPAPRWAIGTLLCGGLCVSAALITLLGRAPEPAPQLQIQRTVRVDGPDLYYIWLDARDQTHTVRSRAQLPSWARSVVEVWHPDWGEPSGYQGGYIVDLFDAREGEERVATLRSRAWIWSASQAGDAGEAHGVLTAFLAGEIASRDPGGPRARSLPALREALEELDARRPPTQDDVIAALRARRIEYLKASTIESSKKQNTSNE